MKHPKHTNKPDWVDAGEQRFYARSKAEGAHGRRLESERELGIIRSWAHESKKFVFEGVTSGSVSYTPDFEVVRADGSVEYHEVKGYWDPKSIQKLVLMARHYPEVKIVTFGAAVPWTAVARIERTRALARRRVEVAERKAAKQARTAARAAGATA